MIMRFSSSYHSRSLSLSLHLQNQEATISAVLRFRNALTSLQRNFPFSFAFGPADTREACIDSAQRVYSRLMMRSPADPVLHFEAVIAYLAVDKNGSVVHEKARDLVKLFRPDRQGILTMLEFVKSIDSVYKELRLLQASIENSTQIDRKYPSIGFLHLLCYLVFAHRHCLPISTSVYTDAFEQILNGIFYIVVITVILAAFGLNPLAMFLSLSSIILGFAFMIGPASSKYFEGMLFILVRRPYNVSCRVPCGRDTSCIVWLSVYKHILTDHIRLLLQIGDLMHVSNVEQTASHFDGSVGWIVQSGE